MAESHYIRGIALSILSTLLYGCVTTFARISYEEGSNPQTLSIFRSVFGIGLCAAFALYHRTRLNIPKDKYWGVALIAVFTSGIALAYLGSVNYIPVGLAALIFFLWPLLLLLYLAFRQPGSIPAILFGYFVLAFLGLSLVIGPVFNDLNPYGIMLALIGACCAAGVFAASQQYLTSLNTVVAAFWVNVGALVITGVITLSHNAFQLPVSIKGLLAVGIASGGYAGGLIAMFLAINQIGAARSALYFNLEPLIATLAAMVLLNEYLSPVQWSGLAIVIVVLLYTSVTMKQT